MAFDMNNKLTPQNIHNAILQTMGIKLPATEVARLGKIQANWNFYEGFHWEGVEDTGKPEVTVNYARAFVDKFVSFELGKGFQVKMKPEMEKLEEDKSPLYFINRVWGENSKIETCIEMGQSKSIAGDAWIQVRYEPVTLAGKPNPEFHDPFGEYPNGKIHILVLPPSIVFPEFDEYHDRKRIKKLSIMYPIKKEEKNTFGFATGVKNVIYKQIWTEETIEIWEGEDLINRLPNKYKLLPFKQIKNFPVQGKNYGVGDIDDVIPLNMEYNLKKSDVSEIIDYHSSPITAVFGARVGNLERGANKVWGGLPKDARIENLKLDGDLIAAQSYIDDIKRAMFEVGNMPEGVLGGDLSISNTSGVALQISLMPILERVRIKQAISKEALEYINKLILYIGLAEKMITIPDNIQKKDFFYNEVHFESILPKDGVLELQEIESEMRLGLENREGAMKRLNKSNIQGKMESIDKEREENPSVYGLEDVNKQLELAEGQAKIAQKYAPPTPMMGGAPTTLGEKPVGTNADGGDKKINAGFTNSPEPKK